MELLSYINGKVKKRNNLATLNYNFFKANNTHNEVKRIATLKTILKSTNFDYTILEILYNQNNRR